MLIFIGAVIVSVVLYKLGSYATIIGLMVTVSKLFMVLVVLVGTVLLFKHWKGGWVSTRFISR